MDPQRSNAAEKLSGSTGSVIIDSPSPRVVVVRMSGHVSANLVPGVIASLNRRHSGDPQDYFFDAWDMTSYDSPVRTELTRWFAQRRSTVASLHTVTRSKLVSMGISVANVVLRIITDHADRASFDSELARRLR